MYVGTPRGRYTEHDYAQFIKDQKDRKPMIYVGSNDGMLHALDAKDLTEQWAFIPGAVFRNLWELTKPDYSHRYFVDGSPNVGDAYFSGKWHTVLVGGLNKGGRSIYALDVTDPTSTSEADAANKLLWEFTDPDLGYTFSQPAVVRMHNGKWAAVFGNGYNSGEGGIGSGKAILYIVDVKDGSIIKKLDTDVGGSGTPNGLATPVLVDSDGDRVVDSAYAGDLRGNLWKFDLRDPSANAWDFAFKAGSVPKPLFTANDGGAGVQPITTRPEVARGPYGAGVMVLFGTGRYLDKVDRTVGLGEPKQSFYGLIDANQYLDSDRIQNRTELREQTIQDDTFNPGAIPVRRVSNNPLTPLNRGWFMNLPANGERQITDPAVRSDRVIFTTLIPNSEACSSGGASWLMEVDLLNGAALPSAPLDTNGDGEVDAKDLLSDDGVASGLMENEYLSRPAILMEPDGDGPDHKIMSGSSGLLYDKAEAPVHGSRGRQSWRQVR
jgi:type IV pilus assembly protein PilY1